MPGAPWEACPPSAAWTPTMSAGVFVDTGDSPEHAASATPAEASATMTREQLLRCIFHLQLSRHRRNESDVGVLSWASASKGAARPSRSRTALERRATVEPAHLTEVV